MGPGFQNARESDLVDIPSIDELIRRVRAGDQDAAAELVKRYEPAIRRAVRFRLADARLGSLLDSMDICQSVLGSFFIRAATGQYKLETPEQLLKLLTTMARNKLISQARKQHAQRRDTRRITSGDQDEGRFVSTRPSPSNQVAVRDLLQEVERRLSRRRAANSRAEKRGARLGIDRFGAWRKRGGLCAGSCPERSTGSPDNWAWMMRHDRIPAMRHPIEHVTRRGRHAEPEGDGPLLSLLLKHQRRAWRRGERALVETYLAQQPTVRSEHPGGPRPDLQRDRAARRDRRIAAARRVPGPLPGAGFRAQTSVRG